MNVQAFVSQIQDIFQHSHERLLSLEQKAGMTHNPEEEASSKQLCAALEQWKKAEEAEG